MEFQLYSAWHNYGKNLTDIYEVLKNYDYSYNKEIDKSFIKINSLEELSKLSTDLNNSLIFDSRDNTIWIYDSYME